MRKNDEIEIVIHDLHANGSGVGKLQCGPSAGKGIAVFVPLTLPGDRIRAKILKLKKKYAYGKLLEIIEPSPDRLGVNDRHRTAKTNVCPVSGRCGGCQFQHYDYQAQLVFKEKLLKDALTKIGGCENPQILPILGMEEPYHYRNKAQFPVGQNGIGFYAPRSHRIVPIDDCNIHHPVCGKVLRTVQDILKRYPISIYNEETHQGLLRHIVVRVGFCGKETEVMVIFVINAEGSALPHAEEIKSLLPYSLLINENTAKTNLILGPNFTKLQGSGYIHEEIGHIRYRISPRAFFQVNPMQTKRLYDVIAAHLQAEYVQAGRPLPKVIDAYSGIGGIALYIAGKAQEVTCIESVPEAVEDGIYNASLNSISNVRFLCGPAEDMLPELLAQEGKADILILDPPRKGSDNKLLDAVVSAKIPKIIYVSCDPATLARDIKHLNAGGYTTGKVQPVDMFPMTGHVETVVLLCRGVF